MATSVNAHMRSAVSRGARFLNWILLALLAIYLLSGIYSVSPNEVGVHLRFGEIKNANVPSGIHYRLPWPVDRVHLIPVHQVQRIPVTDFGTIPDDIKGETGWEAFFRPTSGLRTGYALTGDNNLVNLDCIVQYRVGDPALYLFRFRDKQVEKLLTNAACSTIIKCMASRSVDLVLTTGKKSIEMEIKKELATILDETECGLGIAFVELKQVKAPEKVKKYFDDVINASIDKTKTINQAESYSNEQIPAARARAYRMIEDSEAYRNRVVSEAQGNTARFLDLLGEYVKSKNVTRRRLLIDTMRDIFVNIGKTYLIAPQGDKPTKLKILEG
jgi:modulator of FtsH protease HflK